MKQIVIGIIIGVVMLVSGFTLASDKIADIYGGGDGGWIDIGQSQSIKRTIDKDYGIVCWHKESATDYSGEMGMWCFKVEEAK